MVALKPTATPSGWKPSGNAMVSGNSRPLAAAMRGDTSAATAITTRDRPILFDIGSSFRSIGGDVPPVQCARTCTIGDARSRSKVIVSPHTEARHSVRVDSASVGATAHAAWCADARARSRRATIGHRRTGLIVVGERAQKADQIFDLAVGHRRRAAGGAAVERELAVDVAVKRGRQIVELLDRAADVLGGDEAVARE